MRKASFLLTIILLAAALGVAAAGLAALTLASCGGSSDVFHIYAWLEACRDRNEPQDAL